MAVVKCSGCGAVVTARLVEAEVEVSHGADFLAKCRELVGPLAGDLVCVATECGVMKKAVARTAARMLAARDARARRRRALAVVATPPPKSPSSP